MKAGQTDPKPVLLTTMLQYLFFKKERVFKRGRGGTHF